MATDTGAECLVTGFKNVNSPMFDPTTADYTLTITVNHVSEVIETTDSRITSVKIL